MARLKKSQDVPDTPPEAKPEYKAGDISAPKAKINARVAGADSGFNIFSQKKTDKETMQELLAAAKFADGFKSMSEVRRDYIPVRHMLMQYLIGRIGFPTNTLIEFIGQENLGKSSLAVQIMAQAICSNIPVLYMNTEAKMLEPNWTMRLVGPDPDTGQKILNVMEVFEHVDTLEEMDRKLKEWLHIKRNKLGIPKSVHLLVVIDTASKLLNPEEAAQLADLKDKNPLASVNDISMKPGVTAKWWQTWVRGYPFLSREYNCTVILVNAQNTKMDASAMSAFSPDGGASMNKTKTGGKATDQSSAIQITVTRRGKYKTGDNEVGTMVKLRCLKNSYGSNVREVVYNLRTEKFADASSYIQQAIEMDEGFCNILVEKKICGTTCNRKMFTSEQLGIYSASPSQFYAQLTSNPDHVALVGAALGINGYEAVS